MQRYTQQLAVLPMHSAAVSSSMMQDDCQRTNQAGFDLNPAQLVLVPF